MVGLASLVVIALGVFLSDPYIRILQLKQVRLLIHGYSRHALETRDGRFFYYVGCPECGGTPLIFIHGLGMSSEQWEDEMVELSGRRPVCAVELLGFGRSLDESVPEAAYGIDLFSRQVEAVRRTLGWPRVILAGVSLGGWVAIDVALQHPTEVAGMILVAPGGVSPDTSGRRWDELITTFNYHTPSEFRRFTNKFILHEPRYLPDLVGMIAVWKAERGGFRPFLKNVRFQPWFADQVRNLSMPTAIIWGKQDKVFPFTGALYLKSQVKQSRLFAVDDAGHALLFEEPGRSMELFRRAIQFLNSYTGDP